MGMRIGWMNSEILEKLSVKNNIGRDYYYKWNYWIFLVLKEIRRVFKN